MPVIFFAVPTASCIFRAVPVRLRISAGVPAAPRYAPVSMMMIAFITINSGLVPLIEGLCA